MICSVDFSTDESKLIEEYAEMHNLTVSETIRKGTMEMIEDAIDLEVCRKAIEEFGKNPKTYTQDEIERELDLD